MYFQTKLDLSIYLEMDTGSKVKIFDISSSTIDQRVKQVLPSVHALSGCDSTSCFNGIGKVKFMKVLQADERFIDAAALLGENEHLTPVVKEVLEEFVCRFCGVKMV